MIVRTKFLFMFLVTAVLPLFILISLSFNTSQQTIADRTTENILTISAFKKSRTQILIDSYIAQAKLISIQPTLHTLVNTMHAANSAAAKEQVHQYLLS